MYSGSGPPSPVSSFSDEAVVDRIRFIKFNECIINPEFVLLRKNIIKKKTLKRQGK